MFITNKKASCNSRDCATNHANTSEASLAGAAVNTEVERQLQLVHGVVKSQVHYKQ